MRNLVWVSGYNKMLENENPRGNPYSEVGNCGGFPSILNKPELESAAETCPHITIANTETGIRYPHLCPPIESEYRPGFWKSKPENEGTFHRGLTESDSGCIPKSHSMKRGIW
jgi:hypothetical protein